MLRQHAGKRRARHGVPVVTQAAGRQLQRECRRDRVGGRQIVHIAKARAPAGRGEDAIGVEARRALPRAIGPLLRSVAAQDVVVQRAVVQVAARRHADVLNEHLAFIAIGEPRRLVRRDTGGQPQCHGLRQAPVRLRVARRIDRRVHPADAPFRIRHRAGFLRPRRRRQHEVGPGQGLGARERLLHDDTFGARKRCAHPGLVRQRLRGIGRRDPQHLDAPVQHRVEHVQRGGARRLGQAVHAPQGGHVGAIRGGTGIAMARQQGGHAAGLAAAHRVGLPRQRKRSGTRLADLARRQMQMNQRSVLVGAAGRLVQPHRVQRQRRTRAAEPTRRLDDVAGGHAANALRLFWRESLHARQQG
ncbi:hypothetical protein G6F35_012366 [Rhizopus arrhizus]|nr:hypothetical protein G6F35_012366 [Rhizopus arrhizus]